MMPMTVAASMQEPVTGSSDLLFLLGGAVIALIVFGYVLVRRSRQYPADSPYSTGTGDPDTSDEDEVESFL